MGLVTGAASGLGRATCLLAAQEGAPVLAVDIDERATEWKKQGWQGRFAAETERAA